MKNLLTYCIAKEKNVVNCFKKPLIKTFLIQQMTEKENRYLKNPKKSSRATRLYIQNPPKIKTQ